MMTDEGGAVVARYDYKPFGATADATGTVTSDIQFTGHRTDAENGMIYMNARYYDPQIARFISPDPVIPEMYNPQALNPYSYAYNNPISYYDPSGLQPIGIERDLTTSSYDDLSMGAPGFLPPATSTDFYQTYTRQPSLSYRPTNVAQSNMGGVCEVCHIPHMAYRQPTVEEVAWASIPTVLPVVAVGVALAAPEIIAGGATWTALDTASVWLYLQAPRAFGTLLAFGNAMAGISSSGAPTASATQKGLERVAQIREALNVGARRNIAFASYNVGGKSGELIAVSGPSRIGTVPAPVNRVFETIATGHNPRTLDSEVKLLEYLAGQLPANAKGTVRLFSERPPCVSCQSVIQQFQTKFPGIDLQVISGPGR
jgi:RHS repeat-associated protein